MLIKKTWRRIKRIQLRKSYSDFDPGLVKITEKIVADVKKNGNKALFSYTKKFDRFDVNSRTVAVTEKEIDTAVKSVPRAASERPKDGCKKNRDLPEEKTP